MIAAAILPRVMAFVSNGRRDGSDALWAAGPNWQVMDTRRQYYSTAITMIPIRYATVE